MKKPIVIYHINDTHARVSTMDNDGLSIGFDQISKVINLSLLKNKNTLFFAAGDIIHGTPRINLNPAKNMLSLLKPMRLNYMTLGNHEFNFGLSTLLNLTKQLDTHVVCANIINKKTKSYVFLPYMIHEIDLNQNDYISKNSNLSNEDNIKIGIFGLATPESAYKTNPEHVRDLEFTDPIVTAQSMVALLKNNCDFIIALTHLGLDASSEFTDKRLAEEVEGIDLIIGGHSHTVLEHGLRINNTLITQAGCHNQYLGKIVIDGKNITASLLNEKQVNEIINDKTDSFILKRLNKIDDETNKQLNTIIYHNDHFFSGARTLVRSQECELGNLISSIIYETAQCNLACINGGNLRTDLPIGNITRKNILDVSPFNESIYVIKITGKTIREILEHSVEFVPASFGGFLHVAGVTFTLNLSAELKNRVSNIKINNVSMKENEYYTVAVTNFMTVGGDDYQMLKNSQIVKNVGLLEDIIINYLQAHENIDIDYSIKRIKREF